MFANKVRQLNQAAYDNDVKRVEELIQSGVDVNATYAFRNDYGHKTQSKPAIYASLDQRHIEVFRLLIAAGAEMPESDDDFYWRLIRLGDAAEKFWDILWDTPHLAENRRMFYKQIMTQYRHNEYSGVVRFFEFLEGKSEDVSSWHLTDADLLTNLFYRHYGTCSSAVIHLIEQGVNIDKAEYLRKVVEFGWVRVLDLLAERGVDVTPNGTCPELIFSAHELAMLEKLIELGHDVNLLDEDGNNVLLRQLKRSMFSEERTKILVAAGIDLAHKNNAGHTVLSIAKNNFSSTNIHDYLRDVLTEQGAGWSYNGRNLVTHVEYDEVYKCGVHTMFNFASGQVVTSRLGEDRKIIEGSGHVASLEDFKAEAQCYNPKFLADARRCMTR
jgi:hypothetical protein